MTQSGKFLTGVYPGTFDPVTKGHLHLIRRASGLVDHMIIAVAGNERKNPLFTQKERIEMIRADLENMHNKACAIDVMPLDTLLVDFAREKKASCIIRGLRAVSDFEYEFQMTGMNARLAPEIETIFLMAADRWQFVSSAFVKEIYSLGGNVEDVVTPAVAERLRAKFGK